MKIALGVKEKIRHMRRSDLYLKILDTTLWAIVHSIFFIFHFKESKGVLR